MVATLDEGTHFGGGESRPDTITRRLQAGPARSQAVGRVDITHGRRSQSGDGWDFPSKNGSEAFATLLTGRRLAQVDSNGAPCSRRVDFLCWVKLTRLVVCSYVRLDQRQGPEPETGEKALLNVLNNSAALDKVTLFFLSCSSCEVSRSLHTSCP